MISFIPVTPLRWASLLAALTLASAHPAAAQDVKAGSLTVLHPWARATPKGSKIGAAYLGIENHGDATDRLVGATVEVADHASAHEMNMNGGIMTMRAVTGGVAVPAHGSVTFAPGGLHIMMEDLKHPLKKGDSFTGVLTFEKAGAVPVTFGVESIGASSPSGDMKDGMKAGMPMR